MMITNNPRTRTTIIVIISQVITREVMKVIKVLVGEMIYPTNPNHPKQKYRITDSGKKLKHILK